MELNCGSHMVLLSATAVIVNKMQRRPSEHSGWERAGAGLPEGRAPLGLSPGERGIRRERRTFPSSASLAAVTRLPPPSLCFGSRAGAAVGGGTRRAWDWSHPVLEESGQAALERKPEFGVGSDQNHLRKSRTFLEPKGH